MSKRQDSIKELLGETSVSYLEELIGVNIFLFHSPSLKIDADDVVVSRSFSIKSNNVWYNFSNIWKESANDNTYHKLVLEKAEKPKSILYDIEKKEIHEPCSSIVFNAEKAVISKIEVYVAEDESEEENIQYDYGLVFHYYNQNRLSINVLEESIADELELLRTKDQIERRYKEKKLRLELY